jgi:hypothetical protein
MSAVKPSGWRLIGYDAGGSARQEKLDQEADRRCDQDDSQYPCQQIGEHHLRPGAPEIAECIHQ